VIGAGCDQRSALPGPGLHFVYLPATLTTCATADCWCAAGTFRERFADISKLCAELEGVNACEPVTLGEMVDAQRFPLVAASSLRLGALALFACIGCTESWRLPCSMHA
jgi:hypothetical protein